MFGDIHPPQADIIPEGYIISRQRVYHTTPVVYHSFISIHTSLNEHTRKMFNMDKFKQMKKEAILINTSRGPVVNQEDLTKALQEGIIGGAGLDVTDPEPMKGDNPLLKMPNVVVLPHIASASVATRTRMAEMAAEFVLKGVLGGDINPRWIVPGTQ